MTKVAKPSELELQEAAIAAIKERPDFEDQVLALDEALQFMIRAENILRASEIEDPSGDSAWNELPRAIQWLQAYLDELED